MNAAGATLALIDGPVLVLHAVGDAEGGAPWRHALETAGWSGSVMAPDQPGHHGAPEPVGGNYELSDAALVALGDVADERSDRPTVIGIGVNGWPAQLLALGGRASALVLVDGLNGPWADPATVMDATRDWLRAVADDEADAPPDVGGAGLDPRLRHGLLPHSSRSLAERAAAAMPVPALLVESAASPLPASDLVDLAPRFATGADVVVIDDPTPTAVAEAVVAWAQATATAR